MVFVQDNLARSIYVDGVLDDLQIGPKVEGDTAVDATTIGGILRGSASHWVTGLIDEVAIWKRALSAEETALLHSEGLPGPVITEDGLNLIASWDFNDDSDPAGSVDSVQGITGAFVGGAKYGEGREGAGSALDINGSATAAMLVEDGEFLNTASSLNKVTFAFWQKVVTRTSSSSFWAFSPTAAAGGRGAQAHSPWGGGDIFWDTAGCCGGGDTRINKGWGGDYAAWNHFAFVKNGDAKQIWVNGQLLHSGNNTGALPTDFDRFAVGAMIDSAVSEGGNSLEGSIDDFQVYAQGLTGAQIADLYYAGKELNLAITEQPQSATGVLGWDHTFSVGVSATQDGEPVSGGVDFQWSRNGEAIDGANGSSYTTPGTLTADDSGSSYSVSISFTNKTVTSDEAVLTVAEDSTAPTVASASASKPPQSSEGGGAALEFKGGQYVSVPMDIPETDYTVEFWFRTEDPNAGLYCVVDANLGGGGHDRHLHLTGGNIRVRTWSGPGVEVSSGLNLADGQWHHLAHTLGAAANGQQIFIDGTLVIQGGKRHVQLRLAKAP